MNNSEYQKIYRSKTKEKMKEYRREYYQLHKDEIDEKRRIYRLAHLDEYKERQKRYVDKNKAKIKKYRKEYYLINKEKIDDRGREWSRTHKEHKHSQYMAFRHKFLEMYGTECGCCRESIIEFLTLEHIQGREDGPKKTSSYVDYKRAIQEYRPDLYETLCMNCNHAKGRLGYCPHEKA